ncbi:MAG: type II secretion system F family protein [Elusimicrobiota bacterium]
MVFSLAGLDVSFREWNRRRRLFPAIASALPEAIDLLALVMRAGLDFQVALQQYLIWGPPGPLRDELVLVQREIQTGSSRTEALRNLLKRVPEAGLRETVQAIVQGIEMGTSLSPLLRQQAQSLRQQRGFQAEKKAAVAPLKLMFPLFVFIFPTLLLVLFGPMAISLIQGKGLP